MSVISLGFYCFVAVTLILYYIIPLKFRWGVLLVSSILFFFQSSSLKRLLLMVGMSLVAYAAALFIGNCNNQLAAKPSNETYRKISKRRFLITAGALICEAGILIILVDNAFFINNTQMILKLLNVEAVLHLPPWAAFFGISYYTLILIGYILDVCWETSKPQKNLAKLVLFTSYFPQMASGPFTRYSEMENELFTGHRFDHNNIRSGTQRILWGLFKKLVIAERLGTVVGTIYAAPESYQGLYVLIAVVGYTLQVYADFSGYMDMILGVSELFGVRLPENFRTPFFATNLSEVWRRWHMTLGFWVKDYLLYPCLKSRFIQRIAKTAKKRFGKQAGKKIPTYIGMFLTWFTVGFWHGGSWKYILGSGLFFFAMIVGGQLLEPLFEKISKLLKINTDCFSWHLFQRIRTFLLFAFSVSFGRAASATKGFEMIRNLFNEFNPWIFYDRSLYALGLDAPDLWVLIFSLLLFFFVSILQQKGSIRERFQKQNLVFRWIILFGLIFAIIIFGFYGPGYDARDFIYAGF